VAAPVRCPWQGIGKPLVASATAIKYRPIDNNCIITPFDCQGGSKGGGFSAMAFALACLGVAPPLCTGGITAAKDTAVDWGNIGLYKR